MKCYVISKLDGTGACNNEATQIGAVGQPVCDECAKDVALVAQMINAAYIAHGEKAPFVIGANLSDN